MHYVFLSMLMGTLFGAGMAIAQSSADTAPERKTPRYLTKFDEQFKAADKDGDNALTRQEAQDAKMQRVVESFGQLDVDKDGKVTRTEIRALVRNRLSS